MDDMLRAQQAFPGLSDLVEELAPKWSGLPQIDLPELRFRLIIGDARLEVPRWDGLADAWFLDGFSPAKNPELWEAPLLASVFDPTDRKALPPPVPPQVRCDGGCRRWVSRWNGPRGLVASGI